MRHLRLTNAAFRNDIRHKTALHLLARVRPSAVSVAPFA